MRKPIIIILFALLGILSARADVFVVDGVYYNPISDISVEVSLISSTYSGSLVIPSTVKNGGISYSVTAIGNYASNSCSGLTSVTIPNSVTTIGKDAFAGCSGLTSVTIGEGVTSIGNKAFYGCSSLTSVEWNAINCQDFTSSSAPFPNTLSSITFGDKVESIPAYLCFECSGLTSVTIGEGLTSIKNFAFYGCSGLTSVEWNAINCQDLIPSSLSHTFTSITIGDKVEHIPAYLCYGCSGLTSVTIPNSVTSIGSSAFFNCSGLTSVTISEGVTSIGNKAFYGCTGLTSVTIPNSVTSIETQTFYNCIGLTSMTIPNSVTSIETQAFYQCSGLTSVTIGEGVTSIGESAFYGCSDLTSVTIPEGVTSVGAFVFSGTGLTSVEWNAQNCPNRYISPMFPNTITSITFGDKVELIPAYMCKGCSGLTSVTIPNSMITINDQAFSGCGGLTSVTIGEGVTSIGESAFSGCSGLTSVTIPNNVTSIGDYAFYDCRGLTSVTIGEGVTSIGKSAFYGCSGLTSVTSLAETPPTCGSNAFSVHDHDTLWVSCGSKAAYQTAEGWSSFSEIIGIGCVYVTLSVNDETMGSVTGEKEYALNEQATLEAIPNEGYHFVKWSDDNTDNPRVLTVTQDTSLMAVFAKDEEKPDDPVVKTFTVSLSVNNPAWGSASQNGNGTYDSASSVRITATPNDGYRFINWTKGEAVFSTHADTTFTIKENLALVANFEKIPDEPIVVKTFTLSVSVNNPAWGSASQSGNGTYDSASSVRITATPNEGYRFINWTKGTEVFSTHADTTFMVTENLTLLANFEKIPDEPIVVKTFMLRISVNNPAWGSASQSGNGTYDSASSVTITATANEGYRFVNWTKDNAVFGTQADTTFTITENLALVANFEKIPDEPVANEGRQDDNFRVYAQDRTIHLSEDRGLVQVYNVAGQCVYNGHATSIPVPQSGVYIVAVGPQRFKVLVR